MQTFDRAYYIQEKIATVVVAVSAEAMTRLCEMDRMDAWMIEGNKNV